MKGGHCPEMDLVYELGLQGRLRLGHGDLGRCPSGTVWGGGASRNMAAEDRSGKHLCAECSLHRAMRLREGQGSSRVGLRCQSWREPMVGRLNATEPSLRPALSPYKGSCHSYVCGRRAFTYKNMECVTVRRALRPLCPQNLISCFLD